VTNIQRLVCLVVCSVVLLFGFSVPACAQNVGSLHGTVVDKTGGAVPNAAVTATDLGLSESRTTKTDRVGAFSFAQLTPGTYRVEVEKTGFKQYLNGKVDVLVATSTNLDVQLELGAVTQQVIVESAAAPALNTQDATVGNTYGEDEVKNLPFLARNVINLLTLQPGVVYTGMSNTDQLSMGTTAGLDARDGAVDGVRSNQTNITVDGIDANDWQNQAAFTSALPITLDSVQEFRVTTTNANAPDGIVGGAQVALVTKSGTNEFHGNLRWYYRTSGASANDFFFNFVGEPRGKDQRNIPGGSLGGPIKKKRAYFFIDNEDRREVVSQAAPVRQVPTNTLADGVLVYQCATASACPASTVTGLSGKMYQIAAGNFGLPPTATGGAASVQSLDPAGLGVNPAMVAYMAQLPAGNSPSLGNDGGLAFNGLLFSSNLPTKSNLYTARVDYNLTQDGRQSLFVRGSLEGLTTGLTPGEFPGDPAAQTLLNNSRGIAVNYNAQIGSNLVNSLRYGFTRIGVNISGASGPSFDVRNFSDITDFVRPDLRTVPVNQVSDDATWSRGKHTVSFGGSFFTVRNHNTNGFNSFPAFDINNGFCVSLCGDAIPDGTNAPLPNNPTAFTQAFMMLTGSITQVNATFFANRQGEFLPLGQLEKRDFAENLFESYVQDSWKVRSNVTVTLGLHYGYETPPWEVNGNQVSPTMDIGAYFRQREINMEAGIPSTASPLLSWGLAGKANGKNSWYDPNYHNFAPRVAVAYSPNFDNDWARKVFGNGTESVFRLGAGLFYDRVGQALAVDADQNGSPGIATSLIDNSQQFTLASAPRFSGSCTSAGCTGLPAAGAPYFDPPTSIAFPFTPSSTASNLGFAVDQHLQSPYTIHLTASFQRQLPKGVVLDVAYVGTLGRRLLGKTDFAQYLDLSDPVSKTDLFSAFRQTAALAKASPNNPTPPIDPTNLVQLATIPTNPYFNNVLPNMPAFTAAILGVPGYANLTPTQAFYAFTTIFSGAAGNGGASWSCALFALDTSPSPGGLPTPWSAKLDPTNTGFVLFPPQFAQLNTWTNFANSNYHSLQFTMKKTVPYGSFAFNYVFSKAIDNDSTAENADSFSANGTATGLIQNPFNLRLNRALSDFNLKHNFNGTAVIDLPFGHGHLHGGDSGRLLNALIGGWEITVAARWHSGFPQSPGNGFNFPTNFFLTASGTLTTALSTHVTRNIGKVDSSGNPVLPNLFSNPAAAQADISFTLPGLPGSRNVLTGPAFASLDSGINKNFNITERQHLQFRVTAFNTFNSVNFADTSLVLDPTEPNVFGTFSSTANQGQNFGRQIEFAVRYEF
jgi:hypothetical protein